MYIKLLIPLQLSIRDAFRLSRYEWMREALSVFLQLKKKEAQQKSHISHVTITSTGKGGTKSASQIKMPADCQISNVTATNYPVNSHGIISISIAIATP